MRVMRVLSISGLVLMVLAACSGLTAGKSDDAVVRERAQARWDLLIDGRLESAYQYLASGYRSVTPYKQYQRTIKGVGVWQKARVTKVTCNSDICDVQVLVDIRMVHPLAPTPIEASSTVNERWVKGADAVWGFRPKGK